MNKKMLPTTLGLLQLTDDVVRYMKPVSSLDIYDGATKNFHEEGLFSVSIFGRTGTEQRDQNFSYIDIKVAILHPKIYLDLVRLKGLYGGILSGRETAIWDPALKDFVSDSSPNAGTGYSFFMQHFKDLYFKPNKSPARQQRIELLNRFRNQATTSRIAVIPAGLRDLEVGADGRETKDEINDLYYRMISISNTIARGRDMESSVYDISRYHLTMTMVEIYNLLKRMLEGKKGIILDKWAGRKITHGTRNVIAAMDTSADVLGAPNAPSYDSTVVGLFQCIKALTPLTMHFLKNGYMANIFDKGESKVQLINKKTLRRELVSISPLTRDRWTTKEGLLSVINAFVDEEARHRPVTAEGYYVALVYKAPGVFKVFYDIADLPDGFDRQYVHPMTLAELLYLSGYRRWNSYFWSTTRYPVAGDDSIYSSRIYLKTTTVGQIRKELGDDWQPLGDEYIAYEYPDSNSNAWVNTQNPHSSRLKGMQADFDGDTGSGTALMTDEALEENRRYLGTKRAWVSADGKMRASAKYDTVELVVHNLTRQLV